MIPFVVDIETIPREPDEFDMAKIRESIRPPSNYSKAETIERWMAENFEAKVLEAIHARGLKPETGQIIAICTASEYGTHSLYGTDEKKLLKDFVELVEAERVALYPTSDNRMELPDDLYFVGHNSEFDYGFIIRRMWALGIYPPSWVPRPHWRLNKDFGCSMRRWAGHKGFISLEALCKALDVPLKDIDGITGATVWSEYQAGRLDRIAEYCLEDAKATLACWEKMP